MIFCDIHYSLMGRLRKIGLVELAHPTNGGFKRISTLEIVFEYVDASTEDVHVIPHDLSRVVQLLEHWIC